MKTFILVLLIVVTQIITPLGAIGVEAEELPVHYAYINGFEDSTFRPNEPVTREQVLSILASTIEMSTPYAMSPNISPDVPMDRWSYYDIANCIKAGIVQPLFNYQIYDADGGFKLPLKEDVYPTKPITRGELLGLLFDSKDKFYDEISQPSRTIDFKDISGHRFEKEIIDMANRGIINGYEDNTFRPDNNITRAEFVVIMNAIFNRCKDKDLNETASKFNDISETNWYYLDVMEASITHGY